MSIQNFLGRLLITFSGFAFGRVSEHKTFNLHYTWIEAQSSKFAQPVTILRGHPAWRKTLVSDIYIFTDSQIFLKLPSFFFLFLLNKMIHHFSNLDTNLYLKNICPYLHLPEISNHSSHKWYFLIFSVLVLSYLQNNFLV